MVAGFIIGSEAGFWVLLGLGLILRYVLRRRRTSTVVLALVPVLDVVLIVATAVDLCSGAPAGSIHGLAATYLGSSLAFGPALIRWADVRFAHRFAGGPAPVKPPRHGPERRRRLWIEWRRVVVAAAISSAVLLGLVALVAGPAQHPVLLWWIGRVWVVAGFWFVFGPLWELGRTGRPPAAGRPQRPIGTGSAGGPEVSSPVSSEARSRGENSPA